MEVSPSPPLTSGLSPPGHDQQLPALVDDGAEVLPIVNLAGRRRRIGIASEDSKVMADHS